MIWCKRKQGAFISDALKSRESEWRENGEGAYHSMQEKSTHSMKNDIKLPKKWIKRNEIERNEWKC